VRIVYLHGFASSPQSSKARFFADKFAAVGIPFTAPQLDRGDFETLTITGQLSVVAEAVGAGPAVLMGSSLGGYLAALFAKSHPHLVERVVLLAPAFHFYQRFRGRLTDQQVAGWKQVGTMMVYHYGAKKEQPLGWQLLPDAAQYEAEPAFPQPGLILHGTEDAVIPPESSCQFAAGHQNLALHLLPSGHELTDVKDQMWDRTAAFLQIVHK